MVPEQKKPVASLDLLLSVAESRISEENGKMSNGLFKPFLKDSQSDGIVKKAVLQDGYVYLCRGWKIDESNLKLKKSARNIYEAFFSTFSPKTSKYFYISHQNLDWR